MHHHLDAYAYTQRLHIPPPQKLIFALTVLLIALLSEPPVQVLITIWLSVWTIGYAGIPIRVYGRVLAVVLLFLWTSLPALILEVAPVSQIAASQSDVFAGLTLGHWSIFVSRMGLITAATVAIRSLACVSCLLLIVFTIPFTELLSVLRRWHIPVILLDLLLLMHRFIFLFLDVAVQLQLAQRARGGYSNRQRWMQSIGLLVGQLVVRSLQRYQQFSLGLAARGFNGNLQFHSTCSYTYSRRYILESLLGCLLLLFLNTQL